MKAHHRYELTNRLERLEATGSMRIERDELLTWYDQDRVTVKIWRDIKARWEEIAGEGEKILIWEGHGFFQMLYTEGFKPLNEWT